MSDPSAPFLKHKKQRSRKKCPDKQIMAQDLWLSSRLHGIMFHGIKHQGIKLLNIKLLGLMPHGTRHHSISSLSSNLNLLIIVANPRPNPRPNPSTLNGRRRWKMINTAWSHLFRCKA
jgi:hypothetical protein